MTGPFLAPIGLAVVIALSSLTPVLTAGQTAPAAKAKTTAAARQRVAAHSGPPPRHSGSMGLS